MGRSISNIGVGDTAAGGFRRREAVVADGTAASGADAVLSPGRTLSANALPSVNVLLVDGARGFKGLSSDGGGLRVETEVEVDGRGGV